MPRRENTVGTSRVTYCIMKRQICVWGNQARASCEVEPRRGNSPFPNSRFLCLLFFMECVSLNDSWCSFVFWLIISPFLLPYLNLNHRLRAKHISLFRNSYKVPDARVKKKKKENKRIGATSANATGRRYSCGLPYEEHSIPQKIFRCYWKV